MPARARPAGRFTRGGGGAEQAAPLRPPATRRAGLSTRAAFGQVLHRTAAIRASRSSPSTPRQSRVGAHQCVRDGLKPGNAGGGARAVRVSAGGAEARRQRPPGPVLRAPQARVGGDPVQPGAQRRSGPRNHRKPPGADHGLRHLVLRVVHRAEHPVAVRRTPRNGSVSRANSAASVVVPPLAPLRLLLPSGTLTLVHPRHGRGTRWARG